MKQDLRLLGEITLITVGVVAYGLLGAGVMLAFDALAGLLAGLFAGFIYIVLTLFIRVKIDERRGIPW